MVALTTNFGRMMEAFSQNARGISTAFQLQDGHFAVQYRIQNDMNRARTSPKADDVYVTPTGDIDIERYHLELAAVQITAEYLTALDKAAVAARTILASTVPTNDDVTILPDFGGDYAPSP